MASGRVAEERREAGRRCTARRECYVRARWRRRVRVNEHGRRRGEKWIIERVVEEASSGQRNEHTFTKMGESVAARPKRILISARLENRGRNPAPKSEILEGVYQNSGPSTDRAACLRHAMCCALRRRRDLLPRYRRSESTCWTTGLATPRSWHHTAVYCCTEVT